MTTRAEAPAAGTANFVSVVGGRLFVQETGDGFPLLTLHGWPLDHRMFGPQVESLSDTCRVITFDRRGFGRSDAPPDLNAELDDLEAILEAMGLASAHVLGVSQGGRIALRFAATRPERIRSLVLQGAVVDGLAFEDDDAERVPVDIYAELARAGRLAEAITRWRSHPLMHLPSEAESARRLIDTMLADYAGCDLLSNDAEDGYRFPVDVLASLANFHQPVLLLNGAEETAVRMRHAAELMRVLPAVREIVLANSGHLASLTEPATYNAAVRQFIQAAELAANPPGSGRAEG